MIDIQKGENVKKIYSNLNLETNVLEDKILLFFMKLNNRFGNHIHFGKFSLKNKLYFLDIINTITSATNINYEIIIIEGWQEYQINKYLKNFYNQKNNFDYYDLIADTYILKSDSNINDLKKLSDLNKNILFKNYKKNSLSNKFSKEEIIIIASLVEKEALGENDKRLVSSVIFNRLNKKMKLQIDATTIYSLTNGLFSLNRKLTLKDLKNKHPFNTYNIRGLPPKPISYAGRKTIEIVLENYKTDYLYYFYNNLIKKHIYSLNYEEHKKKLNSYRKQIK